MDIRRELPEDVLADILRRLPPRSLATSRRVCRAWREAIDARRLLCADLLPRAVRGIFMNYCTLNVPEFFSRPTTGPAILGDLDFIPGFWEVRDHCNGLLLIGAITWRGRRYYVANPATRPWARLPRFLSASSIGKGFRRSEHLVCDPMVSPHYEVFLIPVLPKDYELETRLGTEILQSEWPPSSYKVQVFSSLTGRWEEKVFAREGSAAGTIADSTKECSSSGQEAAYWRGALYFHHGDDSFISVFMANKNYKLVPVPRCDEFKHHGSCYLGKSEKGIYCAYNHACLLWIFFLNESCGQSEWVLERRIDLETFARKLHAREDYEQDYGREIPGPWILQNINEYRYSYGNDKKKVVEEKYDWNSDDDNVLDTEDMVEGDLCGYMFFIGFHPFKEVVFLNASLRKGVAYHWNASKFQDLGNIYPIDYAEAGHAAGLEACFPYTPCWMDFPEINWDTVTED